MEKPSICCSMCGSKEFEVCYSTNCSEIKADYTSAIPKCKWDIYLACESCGLITKVGYTIGYFGLDIVLPNEC